MVNTGTQSSHWRTGTDNDEYGNVGSWVVPDNTIQVAVGGQNLFPREGITQPNEKLRLLTQTWGSCNVYPFSNTMAISSTTEFDKHVADSDRIERLNYFGCPIGRPVKDLQVTWSRKGEFNDTGAFDQTTCQYNQQMLLNIYAECAKAIIPGKKGYNVLYV